MKPSICAIGTANPAFKTAQGDIANFMARAHGLQGAAKRRLLALYRAAGIHYRYSVLQDYGASPSEYEFYQPDFSAFPGTGKRNQVYKKHALPLAIEAIQNCLPPGFNVKEITHLITISCTGLYAPGLGIELVEAIGLLPQTRRFAINFMGCYAVFNGLRMARDICRSDVSAKVLIVSVELCSLHFQKEATPDFILSNALFGDGAAAALVENRTQGYQMIEEYCTLLPEGKSEMHWQLGDTGFEMTLSEKVPVLIERKISKLTEQLLTAAGLKSDDITFYAIHPGGKRILTSIQKALGLNQQDCSFSRDILYNYGNMSSATILFVLKEIWNNLNTGDHNKKVLCFAFGPGLTLESMILSIAKT
jgi:predicted naringenin-chalcone synthase